MSEELAYDIQSQYSGYKVDLRIPKGLSVVWGNSGKGKSLLFRTLQNMCTLRGQSCILLDYTAYNFGKDKIVDMCRGSSIILLDNADLYLTDDLMRRIQAVAPEAVIIVAMHHSTLLFDFYYSFLNVEITQGLLKTVPNQRGM